MRLLHRLGWVLAPLASAAALSCAVADTRLDDGVIVPGDGGGGDARVDGAGKDSGGVGTDTSTPGKDSSTPGVDTGGGGTDTGGGGTDTGGGGTDTSTGTDTGGGSKCTVADVSMCASSTTMGSVSGDTGSGTKTATGSDGQWLQINVTEDDSGIFSSKDLKVKITLDSPAGENFDLYVYQGKDKGDGGGLECTTVAGSSTLSSGSDAVSLNWNDNHPVGGHDDTRTITIEVRPAGDPCDPSATWTLTVAGNK
ncbi:MAG: hypothetical protein ABI175_29480 [Polyangiales bacterium]